MTMPMIAPIGNPRLPADRLPLDTAVSVEIDAAEEDVLVMKVVGSVKEEVGFAETGNNDSNVGGDCSETISAT